MPEQKKELSLIENLQSNEKSLWSLVQNYKPQLLKIATESIKNQNKEEQDAFLMKTIISIVKNENLKEVFNSAEGRYSIFEIIRNCLRTGLMLEKHCYAVPQGRKIKKGNNDIWIKEARFDIRDRGYHAILVGGNKPIFLELKWDIVYKKDIEEFDKLNEILIKQNKTPKQFIDPVTNEVNHIQAIAEDRGRIIGVWVQCEHLNKKKEAKFFSAKYIESCREKSQTYQKYIKKDLNTCVWIEFPDQMYIKTAIKSFCKHWADVSEALQNAYYSEKEEEQDYNFDKKPVEDIAEIIIDKQMDNLGENAEIKRNAQEEKEPEVHDEHMKNKEEKKPNGSLFGMEEK